MKACVRLRANGVLWTSMNVELEKKDGSEERGRLELKSRMKGIRQRIGKERQGKHKDCWGVWARKRNVSLSVSETSE